MNHVLSLFKDFLGAISLMAMFIVALLAICAGIVLGGIYEMGEFLASLLAKHPKPAPVTD